MVPDFLHGAPPTDACAAFIKESRMNFVNARELDRKSGCTLLRPWGTRPEPLAVVGNHAHWNLMREGVRVVEAAARNIRAISFDVERCIDSAGAPKGGRACCYLGVCLCYLTPAMAKR